MLEIIRNQPFLVAILAGAGAQFVKVVSFLVMEKRLNLRRFAQADGTPNMHSTAFGALSTAIGQQEGFDSMPFAIAIVLTAIILVDTMNVKNATSRQAETVMLLLDRLRKRRVASGLPRAQNLSYTPFDVFSGTVFGVLIAILIV